MYETEEKAVLDADLAAAVEDLARTAHRQKGRQVSLDELRAFLDGELTEERRESLKDQMALDPGVARTLLELEGFRADVDADPGSLNAPVPDWGSMKRRLREKAPAPTRRRATARWWSDPRVWQAAAALILVAATAAILDMRAELSLLRSAELEPRVNVFQIDVLPVGEQLDRDAQREPRALPVAEARRFLLALNLADPGDYSDYGVEIVDGRGEGEVVWSAEGLEASPLGTFNLELDRGFLAAGTYGIRLFGLEGADRDLLAEYRIVVPSEG